jgi:C1A family cysteine protease
MKPSLLQTAALLLSVARISTFLPPNPPATSEPVDHVIELFNKYIDANKKDYKTPDEYNYRFNVFKDQLSKMIDKSKPLKDQINIESTRESSSQIHIVVSQGSNPCQFIRDLNQFADLSDEEFNRYYLMPNNFLDEHKNKPLKSVIEFENQTTETEALKMKLNDENYDLFTDVLATRQRAEGTNKIAPRATEGKSDYKDLLMDLLQPKSDKFKGVEAKESGVSDTCVSYMYRTQSTTSSKVETPFGSFTRTTTSKSFITGVQLTTKTSNLANLGNLFPAPKRMLQSRFTSRNSGNRSPSYSRYNDDYDYDSFDRRNSRSHDRNRQSSRFNDFDDRRSSRFNDYDEYDNRRNSRSKDDDRFSPSSNSRNSNSRSNNISSSQGRDPFSQSSSAGYSTANSPAQSSSSGPNLPREAKYTSEINIGGVSVPSYLDWRDADIISPIKDQKKCKGCYAFSGIAALEANNALINKDQTLFSEQEIIDCSTENKGCEGGLPSLVFEYARNSGISRETDYPYSASGVEETCRVRSSNRKFSSVSGNVFVKKGVLSLIKALQFGPVAVITYASNEFKYYSNGVFDGEGCDGVSTPNHSALLIGYNLQAPKPYFILKNAWGVKWGQNGYFYMAIGELSDRNQGKCLIGATDYNSFPVIRRMR